MAVAGAPLPRQDHAVAAIGAARDMIEAVAAWREAHRVVLDVRLGLASGSAVGGVIGRRRIVFDLWARPSTRRRGWSQVAWPVASGGRVNDAASVIGISLHRVGRRRKGHGQVNAYLLDATQPDLT